MALCTIFVKSIFLLKKKYPALNSFKYFMLHICILLHGFLWRRSMVVQLHSLQIQHEISLWKHADAQKLNTVELCRKWTICKFIWNAHRYPLSKEGVLLVICCIDFLVRHITLSLYVSLYDVITLWYCGLCGDTVSIM